MLMTLETMDALFRPMVRQLDATEGERNGHSP
jgi:hypothetical protein